VSCLLFPAATPQERGELGPRSPVVRIQRQIGEERLHLLAGYRDLVARSTGEGKSTKETEIQLRHVTSPARLNKPDARTLTTPPLR
jgi:hypothetical protein